MNTLHSWRNEIDEANWIPYKYEPKSVKSIKESAAQFSNRMKFSLANSIFNSIRPLIKLSFIKYDKGRKSGYNTAIGLFLTNAVRGEHPDFEVNFSKMEVSKGALPGLHKWEFSVINNNLSLIWKKNGSNRKNGDDDDTVQLLLFNISKKSFFPAIDWIKRADKKIDFAIPISEKGDYVAWAFLTDRSNSISSNSHFLGKFGIGI